MADEPADPPAPEWVPSHDLGGRPYGATSDQLSSAPTYFSILYSHPLFGHMADWGSNASALPPVNSVRGAQVPAAERRKVKQYGYDDFLPQWGALGPGARATHEGRCLAERVKKTQSYEYPSSPSIHCTPTPALAEIAQIRARTTRVPESTNQRVRLPAHTSRRKQIEARAYEPPNSRSHIMGLMKAKKL
jgi:hypothetical protein